MKTTTTRTIIITTIIKSNQIKRDLETNLKRNKKKHIKIRFFNIMVFFFKVKE
jgi:hypothetical protein